MDGTYKTEFRKVFLLTTNRLWINENMLNRPGRIRYNKTFGDLTVEQISEILEDCLKYPEFKEQIIAYLKPLKIITVDIVKAVVSEVNIFREEPDVCCKDFNVEFKDNEYDIIEIVEVTKAGKKKNEEKTIESGIEERYMSQFLNAGSRWSQIQLSTPAGRRFRNNSEPNLADMTFELTDIYGGHNAKPMKIRIEKKRTWHKNFM